MEGVVRISNRKRNESFLIRLTTEELTKLEKEVEKTKFSREAYCRKVLFGYEPKAMPSSELIEVIKQLRKIGTNMNQIAHQANALGVINREEYKKEYEELQNQIDQIMMLIF